MNTIFLSETANPLLSKYLLDQGLHIQLIRKTSRTYDPVSAHPDIYICSLGPGSPAYFGDPEKLGKRYPKNIIYNAACTGKFLIHNLNYTDQDLLAKAAALEKIHVSQGYTKCNVVVVDENSIITSDQGIYKACRERLDVLLIRRGYVKLSGFPYGFLGGASGRIGNKIIFNGNLRAHPDYETIAAFIKDRDLEFVYFTDYGLEDIGSIIEEVKSTPLRSAQAETPCTETAAGSGP